MVLILLEKSFLNVFINLKSSNKNIEICYFDMEDESIYDTSVGNFDAKQELLKKINQKLLNSTEKSVLILLDNFNYLFTSSSNFKVSLEILSELFSLKKKFKV